MPRTKGSKNKAKAAANNYEALISRAQKEKDRLSLATASAV